MFLAIMRLYSMVPEITLYEFNSLTKMEKTEVLSGFGVFLMEREEPEFRISLFQIHNFYIEVKYSIAKNSIVEFQLFTSTKLLEPYLDQIDISSLLILNC